MDARTGIADGSSGRIRFGIVGSGWRSEFFLRIARELSDRFEVTGLVTRDQVTGRRIEEQWRVRPFSSIDDLVARTSPSFVVVSVPREVAPRAIRHLAGLKVPVLTETPPAPDLEGLTSLYPLVDRGAVIQVAEQYHLSPLLRSQLHVAASGRLGRISQVLVAQCHDYHGVSILRRALGIGFEDVSITAAIFRSPLVQGPDKEGDPREEVTVTAEQLSARFDFGDRLGVCDCNSTSHGSGRIVCWSGGTGERSITPICSTSGTSAHRFLRRSVEPQQGRAETLKTCSCGHHGRRRLGVQERIQARPSE